VVEKIRGVKVGKFWKMLENFGKCWKILENFGKFWNFLIQGSLNLGLSSSKL